jgi:hypothetical protein
VGVILGASLSSSGSPGTNAAPPPPPPPPGTVCGHSGQAGQGSTGPGLCMVNRSEGDASTAFTVRGSGFAPGTPVTLTLTEVGPPPESKTLVDMTSPYHAVAGSDGTFQVPVGQLYPGPLQLGIFTVAAAGSGNRQASTQFVVIPQGSPPGA